jgi:hypothetical protein
LRWAEVVGVVDVPSQIAVESSVQEVTENTSTSNVTALQPVSSSKHERLLAIPFL